MKYMLDTNICIYYINNRSVSVRDNVKKHMHEGICISAITLAELEHGIAASNYPEKNAQSLHQFLSVLDILDFGDVAASCYGIIRADLQRKGQLISPLDMLIAAHAQSADLVLVTNNTREFGRVTNLQLENWT